MVASSEALRLATGVTTSIDGTVASGITPLHGDCLPARITSLAPTIGTTIGTTLA